MTRGSLRPILVSDPADPVGTLIEGPARRAGEFWTWHSPTETIGRWSVESGECLDRFRVPMTPGQRFSLSRDGDALIERVNPSTAGRSPGLATAARLTIRALDGEISRTPTDDLYDPFRVVVAEDGGSGAIAAYRNFLEVFDPSQKEIAWWPTNHDGWGGALSLNDDRAVTWASDGYLRCWTLPSGNLAWQKHFPNAAFGLVADIGTSAFLVVMEPDQRGAVHALILDTAEGATLREIALPHHRVFHEYSRIDDDLYLGGAELVHIDLRTGVVTQVQNERIAAQTRFVQGTRVAFQSEPSGRCCWLDLTTGKSTEIQAIRGTLSLLVTPRTSGCAVLVGMASGELFAICAGSTDAVWSHGHRTARVTTATLDEPGDACLAAWSDGTVYRIAMIDGRVENRWAGPIQSVRYLGFTNGKGGLAWGARADGTMSIVTLSASATCEEIARPIARPGPATRPSSDAAWGLLHQSVLQLVAFPQGSVLAEVSIPFHNLRNLVLAENGRWALLRETTHDALVDLALGTTTFFEDRARGLCWFEPDGMLATAHTEIQRIDPQTLCEQPIWTLAQKSGTITQYAIHPDEVRAAIALDNGTLVVISRFSGRQAWSCDGPAEVGVAWSPDGHWLALHRGSRIEVRNAEKGDTVAEWEHDDILGEVCFATAQRILLIDVRGRSVLLEFQSPAAQRPV